ncbi:MAG: alpha-L-rhamnosidase, partial [Vicinamibacteria bacterium]|jgi:alpha-L-rhamnosidase|nr:alpha-L-rhamnosidase [Vicinamibacteria bacterium]
MAEMAGAIDRPEDAARYRELYETTRAAFARDFILADGSIRESSQAGYALAFTMGLVPDDLRAKCAEKFAATLRERDWHLATGVIGTPRLLPGLHLAGRDDVAARVLLQETHPSWLFPVKHGATTIQERWDGYTPEKGFQTISMNSFNHYAFGSVAEYLHRFVAGIDLDAPGFRKIRLQPVLIEGLTWAQGSYQSISGRVSSAWHLDGERLSLRVEIPPNTEATVYVPARAADDVSEGGTPAAQASGVTFDRFENGAAVYKVGSGRYEFVSTIDGQAGTAK